MIRGRKGAHGFSLIELMIALAIALLALLAATEVYVSTRGTYKIQGMQARLSENGRFSLSMIQRLVLQSGFHPNTNPAAGSLEFNFVNTTTPPNIKQGFFDTLTATSFNVKFFGDGVNTVDCDGAPVAVASSLAIRGDATANTLSCGATDWVSPAGNGTELVDFAVEYGVDIATNSVVANPAEAITPDWAGCGALSSTADFKVRDCVPDTYNLATANANLDKVVAVRICMVLRTVETDTSIAPAAAYKDCANGNIAGSLTDRKLYRTFRSTIQVRNREGIL